LNAPILVGHSMGGSPLRLSLVISERPSRR
jgi:triacylglycerol esterase/lipase EstA (alpha/beta hydrolase family)